MSDSLKLAEMQRTNIEFERQRHLANWLIKSSPHMATPPTPTAVTVTQQQQQQQFHQQHNHQTANNSSSCNNSATALTAAAQATAATVATTNNTTSSSLPTNPSLTPTSLSSSNNGVTTTTTNSAISANNINGSANGHTTTNGSNHLPHHYNAKQHGSPGCVSANNTSSNTNPVFYLMASNGNAGAVGGGGGVGVGSGANFISTSNVTTASKHPVPFLGSHAHHPHSQRGGLHHLAEGRKAKLRRFNSHDTSSNMFSVADFENARLARRNEIELKQRLQRRMRHGYSGGSGSGLLAGGGTSGQGLLTGGMGDYSTGDSKTSRNSNESQNDPLQVEEFLERYSLPRVVRISYKTLFSNETLQSSSSNNSSTVTSNSSSSAKNVLPPSSSSSAASPTDANLISSNSNTGTSSSSASSGLGNNPISQTLASNSSNNSTGKSPQTDGTATTNPSDVNHNNSRDEEQGELFLLYRLVRQRHIYHGHNAKTTAANRKKGVMLPQEFPGYFSLLNEKGLPTATLYTSLVQLVRERVCKFVSVENMAAFMESQANGSNANSPTEGCLNIYSSNSNNSNSRPQYVKTTARGGQVFKLLAVYEDGKQEHNALGSTISCGGLVSSKPNSSHGREKERSRYAQLLNEQRQTLYVSLATKGKFYEIEPGIPQILQKRLDMSGEGGQKKINPDCVHRITALISPTKELPMTLRYISGPSGCASAIPEIISITRITKENIIIACPIEDVDMQSPLHLRKLHLTKEMQLVKNTLGFENEQRMLANPNVQNILKFCQFNCDQFLKMVEVEILQRSERSMSKSRVEGLKILKPLHLPKLLRREKTTISAHEKEDSIIFLSKTDLQNLENKEQAFDQQANRISEKMKVFQSTKKKWFKKQDKNSVKSLTSLDLDVQAKKMSMERYSDMSKLLQERFGDKTSTHQEHSECASEFSGGNSDIGCSDTETTTLATINEKFNKFNASKIMSAEPNILQKSMSLQDIDVLARHHRKPDLLASHHTTDTISEAGTDLEDMENREPLQTSFITEKLYNEFHVKTKQYSKSSSSLHQLLNFSLPQKMQIGENKRSLAQLKNQTSNQNTRFMDKKLDFNIGEPVTGRRAAGGLSLLGHHSQSQNISLMSPLTPSSLIEDDLPYSSVRDSLILSSDEGSPPDVPAGTIRQALHLIDYTKENIYAEICHEASAMGGIPSSHTRDTFSAATHSTEISDDYGDYASLTFPPYLQSTAAAASANNLGSAISRVQINCSASPVSYHTVYLGDEPLGEKYVNNKQNGSKLARGDHHQRNNRDSRSHVTTVDVGANGPNGNTRVLTGSQSDSGGLDNIYNTLK